MTHRLESRLRFARLIVLSFGLLCSAACKEKAPPAIATLPEFSLMSDSSRTFTKTTFREKPTVVAFFFTRCPSVCPRLIETLKGVEKALGERSPRFVLVSVDPENDDIATLKAFREKLSLSPRFELVTGNHNEIMRVTEEGFHIGVSGKADSSQENFGITHGSHYVLVDAAGNIRGYYQSDSPEKVEKLKQDLEAL